MAIQRSSVNPFATVQRWFNRNQVPVAVVIGLVILWEITGMLVGGGAVYFPSASYTLNVVLENPSTFADAIRITMYEIVLGFIFSVVIGVFLGLVLNEFYTFRQLSMPSILYLHTIPLAVMAPLFLSWFGADPVGISVFIAWGGFFPVFISALTGFSQVPPEFDLLANITGATRLQRIRYIKVWTAIPNIASGLKLAANLTVIAAIIAEFIGAGTGLGYLIIQSNYLAKTGMLFATFIIIVFIGVGWFSFISLLVDYLNPASD